MTFGQSIVTCFRKYADFTGRASRPEYWWFVLFTFLVSAALNIIGSMIALGRFSFPMMNVHGYDYNYLVTYGTGSNLLSSLWSLAVLLPGLAVAVRRLRDSGRSWANLFWLLLPIAGLIVLIVQLCKPSLPQTTESPVPSPPPPPPVAPAA